MNNKKGFTLIELIAVIVVLAIVMVLAVSSILPYMSSAREDAFRIEATNAVDAAEYAVNMVKLGDLTITNSNDTRYNATTKKYCFTINGLVTNAAFEADTTAYKGKVVINASNKDNVKYTLYLKKNDEFAIIGGTVKNYSKSKTTLSQPSSWTNSYNLCLASDVN